MKKNKILWILLALVLVAAVGIGWSVAGRNRSSAEEAIQVPAAQEEALAQPAESSAEPAPLKETDPPAEDQTDPAQETEEEFVPIEVEEDGEVEIVVPEGQGFGGL